MILSHWVSFYYQALRVLYAEDKISTSIIASASRYTHRRSSDLRIVSCKMHWLGPCDIKDLKRLRMMQASCMENKRAHRKYPSWSKLSAVASGLFQYSLKRTSPFTASSPDKRRVINLHVNSCKYNTCPRCTSPFIAYERHSALPPLQGGCIHALRAPKVQLHL